MKKKNLKKKFLIGSSLIFLIFIFAFFIALNNSHKKTKDFPINPIIREYYLNGNLPESSVVSQFQENSSERYFLMGIDYFSQKNMDSAEYFFQKSLKSEEKNNPILDLYTYFYLNQCKYNKNGYGNYVLVGKVLDIMKNSPSITNDTDLIWQMILTIINNKEYRENAVTLLNNYLESTKNLELENRLKIKGYVAMLKMINEEYGESIYTYYEILSQSEKLKNADVRSKIQIKCREYLGNMYFILEDYPKAIAEYNKAITVPIKNSQENAVAKYASYINRSESYIQTKKYEEAEKMSKETEKIISFLPENLAVGAKIFRYKNLILLESYKHNFEQAKKYYEICQELLTQDKGNAFLNSEMYVELAYCEMLIQMNQLSLAEEKLVSLLKKDSEESWGFDSTVYFMLLKIYRETNQSEKYFEMAKKVYLVEKNFNDTLKKDYLEFVKNAYTFEQLQKQERILKIRIFSLSSLAVLALISICLGITKIKKLSKGNFTDSLTETYNRKYLNYLAEKKPKFPFNAVIVMTDIDYFKKYNDFYGHIMGDIAIKKTAEILKQSIRKDDIVIRYGGEEFLVILKNADMDIFKEVYKRITDNLQKENIIHEKSSVSDRLTLSMGVSFKYFDKNFDLKDSIKEADKALYISKEEGRNRYSVYEN